MTGVKVYMRKIKVICLLLALLSVVGCASKSRGALTMKEPDAVISKQAKKPASFADSIGTYASLEERVAVMSKVAGDGQTSILFDETTADVALVSDGLTYVSTPWDLAVDAKATGAQKNTVASQVRLTYMDSQKNIKEISSFAECIAKGQYTVQNINNGIQVNMVIGKAEQRTMVPPALPESSFQEVLSELEGRSVSRMKAFYKLYDPETTPENQLAIIRDKYPVVDETAVRVLKEITDKERNELEDYFEKAGYTFERMETDLKNTGASELDIVKPRFEISVQYTLEDGALCVRVPSNLISYDRDHFSLLEVGVLEYMAAAPAAKGGYLLLPDGSGTVVGFNGGSKSGADMRLPVYGYDRALTYLAGYDNLMTACLPVYGIKSPYGTMLTVIGEGAAMADIIATSGGSYSSYARAGAAFSWCDYDTFEYKDVNTQYSWSMVDKNTFTGTYELKYIPLAPGSGYSDMAKRYRETLKFAKNGVGDTLPLTVGLFGSIRHQDQVAMVPVNRQVALTEFGDAVTVAKELEEGGVDNFSLRLLGWTDDGLDTGAFSTFSPGGVLGGSKGFEKLKNYADEHGFTVYPDADFSYVKKNALLDSFRASEDTSRMLDKTYAGYNRTRMSSGLMDPDAFMYAVKPRVALEFFDRFMEKYIKNGATGLSLGSLGGNLNSDKSQSGGTDRATAQLYVEEMLKTAGKNVSVMAEGSNAYVFAYANQLVSVPAADSGYPDADHSVPFLQMVIHGKIPYTTSAVNLSGDFRNEILKAVETGSGLYYELAYRNTDLLKTSAYADIYSADFETWKKQLIESYSQVNAAIGDLSRDTIENHEQIEPDFVKVTYSSGAVIYVNYSDAEKTDGGNKVAAKSFLRVK